MGEAIWTQAQISLTPATSPLSWEIWSLQQVLGLLTGRTCPKHLALEASRKHPGEMPEPPQLLNSIWNILLSKNSIWNFELSDQTTTNWWFESISRLGPFCGVCMLSMCLCGFCLRTQKFLPWSKARHVWLIGDSTQEKSGIKPPIFQMVDNTLYHMCRARDNLLLLRPPSQNLAPELPRMQLGI